MQSAPLLRVALTILASSSLLIGQGDGRPNPGNRPNILVILADDMGYSDIGCYGSEIETPQLDALAANGLRFTQFYNGARCCPTRASLLTGLYAHQTGIGWMVDSKKGAIGYQGDLNDRCVTIAEVQRGAGYRNYACGKWHVTPLTRTDGELNKHNWPLQRGFDRYYGTIHGAGSLWDPNTLVRGNQLISPYADADYEPNDGFFYTDAISDHATKFIRDHHEQSGEQPFFMYVAYTAAHWPMHARERDIKKYRGRYSSGFAAVREARRKKQQELGVIDEAWPVSDAPGSWEKVKDQAFEERCMEVYAAMVDSMDQGIGRIVDSLRETGELNNTLILYLQDNGGCAEGYGRGKNATKRKNQPSMPIMAADALQDRMTPKQTRDGYPVRQGYGVMPGAADTYVAYGKDWANVSNTPFRMYKHWTHEGGIATPLIAHWPKGIRKKGVLRHQISHLIDLMATAIDLSGAKYPEARAGSTTLPLAGISLRPALEGKKLNRSNPLFFEHEGNRAARDGKWKLVAQGPRGKWQLHDMEKDRVEATNLAAEFPAVTSRLVAAWEAWAERCQVLPWPYKHPYEDRR
jgi:arylsulfatase A-like enzyme